MKTMFLLRGAQASGKSTIIKELNLKNVVSTDSIRLSLGGTEMKYIDGKDREVIAWDFPLIKATFDEAHRLTRKLCKTGDDLVIDALNIVAKSTRQFINIALEHGYEVCYIDVQGNLPVEELLRRNKSRPDISYVSEELIRASHERHLTRPPIEGVKVLTLEEAYKILSN